MVLPANATLKQGLHERRQREQGEREQENDIVGLITLKQMADELGVSKQAIYRYVKKNCINEAHQRSGVMYLDEAVQMRIKRAFLKITASNDVLHDAAEAHREAAADVPMYTFFEETIMVLREQLEAKDRQIAALYEELAAEREHGRQQAVELGKLADQAQQLQAMHNTSVQKLLDEGKPRKKGFFERFRRVDEE